MIGRSSYPVLGVIAAATVYACTAETPTTPNADAPLFGRGGPAPKVDICHRTGNGSFHLINVSQNAEAAHRAHGDGQVGDPVPDMVGFVFDEGCVPVVAIDCPCFTAGDLDGVNWAEPLQFLEGSDDKTIALATDIVGSGVGALALVAEGTSVPEVLRFCGFFDDVAGVSITVNEITLEECDACTGLIRAKAEDLGLISP